MGVEGPPKNSFPPLFPCFLRARVLSLQLLLSGAFHNESRLFPLFLPADLTFFLSAPVCSSGLPFQFGGVVTAFQFRAKAGEEKHQIDFFFLSPFRTFQHSLKPRRPNEIGELGRGRGRGSESIIFPASFQRQSLPSLSNYTHPIPHSLHSPTGQFAPRLLFPDSTDCLPSPPVSHSPPENLLIFWGFQVREIFGIC